jgi:hypothetical protein
MFAGEGLSTLMDTVESSLGVPDPTSLARADSATELATEPNTTETGNQNFTLVHELERK